MRTSSHITGDVGQAAVSLIFKEWGWTADLVQSDYGEDLDCQVFVDNQRTPFYFRCQVKSSDDAERSVTKRKAGDFAVRISGALCREWLLAYFPVVLVVYDRMNRVAYWSDATSEVRDRIEKLGAKKVSLSVPTSKALEQSKDDLISIFSNYYARLLRVESEEVERTVFPVLMPGYRVLSFFDETNPFRTYRPGDKKVESTSVSRDDLPAWAASLRSLDGNNLSGAVFRAPHADLASFAEGLICELGKVSSSISIASNEWFAFVCGPLRYKLNDAGEQGSMLGRDLTTWQSYAAVNGRVVHDHDYAFGVPTGYVRQIGRRARSWDGYFLVSTEHDLAVQMLVGISPTPGEKSFMASLCDHAHAQYIPWSCPRDKLDYLYDLLGKAELVFNSLENSMLEGDDGRWVHGAICTPMFAPWIGLIPRANNWRELEAGSVQQCLEGAGLLKLLPGQPGDSELVDRLEQTIRDIGKEPPPQWMVNELNARPGLPIDLSDRMIIVQRMRASQTFDLNKADSELSELRHRLRPLSVNDEHVDVSASFDVSDFASIAVLTAVWKPHLNDRSVASIEKATSAILTAFDRVLPRNSVSKRSESTIDVLRLSGELYFEGDRLY